MRIADTLSQMNLGPLSLDHEKRKDGADDFGKALAQAGISDGPAISEQSRPVEVTDWDPYKVSNGGASIGVYTSSMAQAAVDQMHSIKTLIASGLQTLIDKHEAFVAMNPAAKEESAKLIETYKADMATAAQSWETQIFQFEHQMASFLSRDR